MSQPKIVSQAEWVAARKALLAREKELTRQRDAVNAARREMPRVKVEKEYVFDTTEGRKTLAELFDGRSQLIVQHFMFAPDWDEGCVGCSFATDHVEGALVHLEHHDVSYVLVSRAPLAKLEAYRKRMGWRVRWASSRGSEFNYDFHVSFRKEDIEKGKVLYNYELINAPIEDLPGASVFCKDASGAVFHTYSSFGRGGEEVLSTYMLLDLTPKGRNETGPNFNLTDWVKRHDRYDNGPAATPLRHTSSGT